jgi:hypothetical protein
MGLLKNLLWRHQPTLESEIEPFESSKPEVSWSTQKASRAYLSVGKLLPVECFFEDDEGFRSWLVLHPTGYTLNCDVPPRAEYLILHRASCGSINGDDFPNSRLTSFLKVCSDSADELDRWAIAKTQARPTRRCRCFFDLTQRVGSGNGSRFLHDSSAGLTGRFS